MKRPCLPPVPCPQPVIRGAGAVSTFLECVALSEFTQQFGSVLDLAPMTAREVTHMIAWPLEARGALEHLMCGLLRYLLAQWVSAACVCVCVFGGQLCPCECQGGEGFVDRSHVRVCVCLCQHVVRLGSG